MAKPNKKPAFEEGSDSVEAPPLPDKKTSVEEGSASVEAPPLPVPTFTIRADSQIGIRAIIAIRDNVAMPADDRAALDGVIRDFELYEEATR